MSMDPVNCIKTETKQEEQSSGCTVADTLQQESRLVIEKVISEYMFLWTKPYWSAVFHISWKKPLVRQKHFSLKMVHN